MALAQRRVKAVALQVDHLLRRVQFDAHPRVAIAPTRDARQQPALRERRQHGDPNPVVAAAGGRGGGAHAVIELRQRGFNRLQQCGTRGIQHHAAAAPVEQREAELLFQALDLLADGAVGEMQLVSRRAQIGELRDGAKRRQGVQRQADHAGKHN